MQPWRRDTVHHESPEGGALRLRHSALARGLSGLRGVWPPPTPGLPAWATIARDRSGRRSDQGPPLPDAHELRRACYRDCRNKNGINRTTPHRRVFIAQDWDIFPASWNPCKHFVVRAHGDISCQLPSTSFQVMLSAAMKGSNGNGAVFELPRLISRTGATRAGRESEQRSHYVLGAARKLPRGEHFLEMRKLTRSCLRSWFRFAILLSSLVRSLGGQLLLKDRGAAKGDGLSAPDKIRHVALPTQFPLGSAATRSGIASGRTSVDSSRSLTCAPRS